MIVRRLSEAEQTDRRVVAGNWESTRLLLRSDKMGFSFHITTIYEGTESRMWYRNHLEAVYCMEGEGTLEDADGRIQEISPGALYALDEHDQHVLRARTTMRMACVFNPALHGKEVHDAEGVYPAEADEVTGR